MTIFYSAMHIVLSQRQIVRRNARRSFDEIHNGIRLNYERK